MKVWVFVTVLLVESGCSHLSVHCDGRLTPINAPAPSDPQAKSMDSIKSNDPAEVSP